MPLRRNAEQNCIDRKAPESVHLDPSEPDGHSGRKAEGKSETGSVLPDCEEPEAPVPFRFVIPDTR